MAASRDPLMSVAITATQLDTTRRAVLHDFGEVLAIFADKLHELREKADMHDDVTGVDAAAQARLVRQYLDALDALGWPGAPGPSSEGRGS